MLNKVKISILVFVFFFSAGSVFAALSCSVSATCSSPNVVVFRMFATSNSHAELPSQSNYGQLVCCGGVTGLSNTCSGTYGVVLRLSGDTNAHVEENSQTTAPYNGHNTCLSVSSGTVSVGYQNNNCSGFDTTVASLSKTPTNAHVGDGSIYTRKVCASASASSTPPVNLCSNISCGGGALTSSSVTMTEEEKKVLKEKVLKIADLNFDGRVDILDLSILLYYIDQYEKTGNYGYSFYDLNKDGRLDFLDVSVMFYYWDLVF